MRTLAITALACLTLVLQSALWRYLPFELAAPHTWQLLARERGAHAATGGGAPVAGLAALIIGLNQDVLAGAPTGLFGFSAVAIALVAALLSKHLLLRGRVAIGGTGMTASLIGAFFVLGLLGAEGAELRPGLSLMAVIVVQAFMTALAAVPLFPLLRRVEARTSRQRARDLAREGLLR